MRRCSTRATAGSTPHTTRSGGGRGANTEIAQGRPVSWAKLSRGALVVPQTFLIHGVAPSGVRRWACGVRDGPGTGEGGHLAAQRRRAHGVEGGPCCHPSLAPSSFIWSIPIGSQNGSAEWYYGPSYRWQLAEEMRRQDVSKVRPLVPGSREFPSRKQTNSFVLIARTNANVGAPCRCSHVARRRGTRCCRLAVGGKVMT